MQDRKFEDKVSVDDLFKKPVKKTKNILKINYGYLIMKY